MNRKPLLFTFAFIFAAPLADADVLAGWNVGDSDGTDRIDVDGSLSSEDNYAFESTTTASNIAGATLSLGPGVNPSTTAGQYGFKIGSGNESLTLANAITNEHFIQFNISAVDNFHLNLSSLEMTGESSGNGANAVAILTSIDGFVDGKQIASVTDISDGIDDTGGFDTDSSGFGAPIDLTGSSYQGINTISFRIYGWDTGGGAGITYLRGLNGDNLIINGAVVPETSTVLPLAGLLGLTIIGSRRRKA